MTVKKIRIIASPIVPRNLPYQISTVRLQEFINTHKSEFKSILYIGWVKRTVEKKRVLKFLVATADNSKDARLIFKKGETYGIDLWDVNE